MNVDTMVESANFESENAYYTHLVFDLENNITRKNVTELFAIANCSLFSNFLRFSEILGYFQVF